jgi:hypothetical protein
MGDYGDHEKLIENASVLQEERIKRKGQYGLEVGDISNVPYGMEW